MKIQVASDLHVEFERKFKGMSGYIPFELKRTDADVIVLAGDVGVGFTEERKFCEKLASEHNKPVVFVLGNHSFYNKGNIDRIRGKWSQYAKEESSKTNVHYIDDGHHWKYQDVNFVGGIFWTDFNDYDAWDMKLAQDNMNDYRGCRMSKMDSSLDNRTLSDTDQYSFTPRRSVDEHYKTKEYMSHMLDEWKGQKNVVVTHHLPSGKSTDARYRDNSLNPAYHSNLEWWIEEKDISLWVHGHTHGSNDYSIGDTRVVCNPRGYFRYDENQYFDNSLIIEV